MGTGATEATGRLLRCPACDSERMGHHSSYQKYLYEQRITILRLRCRGCGRTHAVIPSWSLPDTSVGTAEVESAT